MPNETTESPEQKKARIAEEKEKLAAEKERIAAEKLAEKEARAAQIKAEAEAKVKAKLEAETKAREEAEAQAAEKVRAEAMKPGPDEKFLGPDAAKTKAKLMREPQVRFYIPLIPGEKKGAEENITINGYQKTIKKGQYVYLPESMAATLEEHYNIEMDAGKDMRLDRAEIHDGVSIETAFG